MTKNELGPQARRYEVRIIPGSEGDGFLARIPAFPSIFTSGDTPEEALANGYAAIELVLEVRLEDGRALPEPDAIPA